MSPARLPDFVHDQTHDGRAYWTLNIINEFAREALVISRLRLSAVMIQPRMSGMRKSCGIAVISLDLSATAICPRPNRVCFALLFEL